jgi:nucleoid-associated protein YgaU
MKSKQKKFKFFKSSEEVISMFLGLVIVGLVIGLLVNYFQRSRGKIDLPGITDKINLNLTGEKKDDVITKNETERSDVYEVKKGDSLWKIAVAKLGDGNRWTEIARDNNLQNVDILLVGQNLKISTMTTTTGEISEYIVKQGDNLWNISVQVYGDGYQWINIYRANKNFINNPNKIEIGMKLALPSVKSAVLK